MNCLSVNDLPELLLLLLLFFQLFFPLVFPALAWLPLLPLLLLVPWLSPLICCLIWRLNVALFWLPSAINLASPIESEYYIPYLYQINCFASAAKPQNDTISISVLDSFFCQRRILICHRRNVAGESGRQYCHLNNNQTSHRNAYNTTIIQQQQQHLWQQHNASNAKSNQTF